MTQGLPSSRLLHRSMLATIALSASLGHAATFNVTTNADWNPADPSDGEISLREAILAANTNAAAGDAPAGDAGQDIIIIDLSTAASTTITLSEGEYSITEDLDISTSGTVAIDAGSLSRAFNIDGSSTVAISGLSLSNGSSTDNGGAILVASGSSLSFSSGEINNSQSDMNGGAIWVGGSLTLNGSTLDSNSAGLNGGAVAVAAGANADLTDGLLQNNSAAGAQATEGGGALYNAGTLTVTGTRVEGNMATGASGSGGGLLNVDGVATVNGGFWQGNMAPRAGGAIEDRQGSVPTGNSLTLSGIDFFQNSTAATAGNPANPGNGGALHITGNGRVSIERSSMVENTAANEGGALWNHNSGELTVINSTVSGNSAPTGGGVFTQATANTRLLHVTIANNTVTGDGGGIQHNGTDVLLTLENSIVSGNSADGEGPDINGAATVEFSIVLDPSGLEVTSSNTSGNFIGFNPGLADLAFDGGSQTRFHAISAVPALDNADETLCTEAGNVDQRGLTRPVDGTGNSSADCDIGAYERTNDLSIELTPATDSSGVQTVVADENDVVALLYSLENTTTETIEIRELSGGLQGSGNFDTGLENVRLFLDDGDGVVGAGDTDITARVVIDIDNAGASFTITLSDANDPIVLTPSEVVNFMLVVDISTAALEPAAAHLILPGIALLWLRRYRKTALAALALALLTACGGGSDSDGGFDDSALGGESNSYRFTLRSIQVNTQGGNDLVIVENLPVTGKLLLREAE